MINVGVEDAIDLGDHLSLPLTVKLEHRTKVESHRPQPFRSLVIVEALGGGSISFVFVVVITAISPIGGIERLHAKRALEQLSSASKGACGVRLVKHLGSNNHGDEKVGTKLIVGPSLRVSNSVFVDAAMVDDLLVDLKVRVIRGVGGDEKVWLKR